jgi:hypothetical protein
VGDGRTEDGDDGIADELLYRSAVALEFAAEVVEIRPQDRLDVLGAERLRARR